jgi:hypothetical protein
VFIFIGSSYFLPSVTIYGLDDVNSLSTCYFTIKSLLNHCTNLFFYLLSACTEQITLPIDLLPKSVMHYQIALSNSLLTALLQVCTTLPAEVNCALMILCSYCYICATPWEFFHTSSSASGLQQSLEQSRTGKSEWLD